MLKRLKALGGHWPVLKNPPQHKAGMRAGDPFDAIYHMQQQMLIVIHILDQYFELKISRLSGNNQALNHIGKGTDMAFKIIKALRRMLIHRNVQQHH